MGRLKSFHTGLHLPDSPKRVRVLDAIGVLENADADFALLRNTMTHDPNKKNFRDEAYHNVTRSRGKHQQTESNPCLRSIDYSNTRLQRAICKLYRVDYTCFPVYELPEWCVNLPPEDDDTEEPTSRNDDVDLNQEFAARCPGVTNERGGCGSAGFADGALSAEACQAICQATRDCKFFSYHVDRPDKRCRFCKDDTHDTRVRKCFSSAERAADPTLHECYWGPKYCRRDDLGTRPDGKREPIHSFSSRAQHNFI